MHLQYVYSQDQLQTFSEELSVLTDALLNPSKNREKAAEVSFETFNVSALFMSVPAMLMSVPAMLTSVPAMLSLYTTGHTTGRGHLCCLNLGGLRSAAFLHVVDGAGRNVSRCLQQLPHEEGVHCHTSAESEVV